MRWQHAARAAFGLLLWAAPGVADERRAEGDAIAHEEQDCAAVAERAQDLRSSGKLLQASIELRACLRASCPSFVRQDCAKWSTEVEASLPTVVLRARDGHDRELTAVRVSVDGALLCDHLDGLAKPLDPGAHHVRFERQGSAPIDQDIVVYEGEKLRPIDARWPLETAPGPAREERVWPWVLGGLGVATLASGAVLTGLGVSDYHALQQSCGRTGSCSPSEVNAQRARLWLGNVSMVVGAIAVGAATWIVLTPAPGGAAVQVSGRI
jgi:hypothetical protein